MFILPPEMRETYLKRRLGDLATLRFSLETNSLEAFHKIGHQIIGTAKNYGFSSLEPIAARMEKLSAAELIHQGPLLIEEFSTWLNNQNLKQSINQ